MKYTLTLWAALFLLFNPIPGRSAETELEELARILSQRFGAISIEQVSSTPLDGVYQVAIDGRVLYVSGDGRYMLSGRLIDLDTREDLTERVQSQLRVQELNQLPEERMIVFESSREARHTLTTFTYIDCPYCRRMHSEMDELNGLGIRVRYLLYPRAGIPSVSYDKAVSVWCAKDQQVEMTKAKAGMMPRKRDCPNPVQEHMSLARRLGLNGTPYTITDTGRVIAGYMPAVELFDSLEADKRGAGE